MKASELVSKLSALVAEHGDLEIVFDCDSVITELAWIEVFNGPYPELPIFIIHPSSQESRSSI